MDMATDISAIEEEFFDTDSQNGWNIIFQRLKNEASVLSQDCTTTIARAPENRNRNRYRDVSPYDHSRVCLTTSSENDYINANLVSLAEYDNREYILTQGPLTNTESHFWLMVWEQKSPVIVMLNRVIEKGVPKCSTYFPMGYVNEDVDTKMYEDVGMKVVYKTETDHGFYLKRELYIEHMKTGERHPVLHFHYLVWPDFGVPRSPSAFLNFLWAVRRAGAFSSSTSPSSSPDSDSAESSSPLGPPIVHCSAGIGRSGTFALVDSLLVKINQTNSFSGVNIRGLLLKMRRDRMGLIQTSEQLRFSYQAVIEGGKHLLATPLYERNKIEFPMSAEDRLPPMDNDSSSSTGSEMEEIINFSDSEEEEEEEEGDLDDGAIGASGHGVVDPGYIDVAVLTRKRGWSQEPDATGFDEEEVGRKVGHFQTEELFDSQNTGDSQHTEDGSAQVEWLNQRLEGEEDNANNDEDIMEVRRQARQERMARTKAKLEEVKARMRREGLTRSYWTTYALAGGLVAIAFMSALAYSSYGRR